MKRASWSPQAMHFIRIPTRDRSQATLYERKTISKPSELPINPTTQQREPTQRIQNTNQ